MTVAMARLERMPEFPDRDDGVFVARWRSIVYLGRWQPGARGCPSCLLTRVVNSPFGPPSHGDVVGAGGGFAPAYLRMVDVLAAELLVSPVTGDVTVFDTRDGSVVRQPLLPDSRCPVCGGPASDAGPAFTDPAVPLAKLAPTTLRTRTIDAAIEDGYLRQGIGLFKEVKEDLQSPFGACSVDQPARWGRREPAIGRAGSYLDARRIAVLEGLERYAGLCRGGERVAVRATYGDVADRAISPLRLGTHPPECYDLPDFAFRPFAEDVVVDWVTGYSFTLDAEVLVPERIAYWGPRHDGETSFVYETSNGCALGASVEEAVLHGLRELVERDSFLLTWYRRLALPEVDLDDAPEPLRLLLAKAALFTGRRFRAFDSTMEHGMPSFWLAAMAPDGGVIAGAGAHPDPVQALTGGLHELVGAALYNGHHRAARRDAARAMLADTELVRGMDDHAMANSLPEARERFAFLLDSPPRRITLRDIRSTVCVDAADIRTDLATAVAGMRGSGLDVVVVDQTMPELARAGLVCVKVLVPGLVPMTFGHRHRRTVGLPRLAGAVALPHTGPLGVGEIADQLPHPFP